MRLIYIAAKTAQPLNMRREIVRIRASTQSGFSLLEVAMVMIIGGILLSLFAGSLLTMIANGKMETTQERMRAINDAIQIYVAANNKLPCVASRNLDIQAAANLNYGRELPVATGSVTNCDPNEPVPNGTVRTGSGANRVRIGMVPTRTLNLPDEIGFDAWGSRFIYAVSENLATTPEDYKPAEGKIIVEDAGGTPINSAVTYVLVSVGGDRAGGWGIRGRPTVASPTEVVPCGALGATLDQENCDDDRRFVATMMRGSGEGGAIGNHYDDYLIYEGNFQTSLIPSGALMPFDRSSCPPGWTDFAALRGRILIGTGTFTEPSQPPKNTGTTTDEYTFTRGQQGGWHSRFSDQTKGGAIRVENMPPYVAYRYCRKN